MDCEWSRNRFDPSRKTPTQTRRNHLRVQRRRLRTDSNAASTSSRYLGGGPGRTKRVSCFIPTGCLDLFIFSFLESSVREVPREMDVLPHYGFCTEGRLNVAGRVGSPSRSPSPGVVGPDTGSRGNRRPVRVLLFLSTGTERATEKIYPGPGRKVHHRGDRSYESVVFVTLEPLEFSFPHHRGTPRDGVGSWGVSLSVPVA